jgi:radical SAM superfamily enzyme YgiQ (UPF0313 family)
MRILLAYKSHAAGAADPYTSLLPVGLGYINACLRKGGFQSKVANFSNIGWKKTEELLNCEKPGILGVSQFSHNRLESLRIAGLAKKLNPACFVVFGGPHATHLAREILDKEPAVDAVILGEGEEAFLELAQCLVSKRDSLDRIRGIAFRGVTGVEFTPPRGRLADLDLLPIPAACFDDAIGVDLQRQLEFIITSRGCPAVCRFCASPRFWGKALRFRSPRSIVDEIRFIRDRFGLLYFSIRDDTFTADRERVLEFCRLLVREKVYILWNCQSRVNAVDGEMLRWMKRAGCECVQFGVESGSPGILRALGKGITPEQVRNAAAATRKAGINLSVYLITGVPGENEEDLTATINLIEDIKPNDGQVSPLAYYPGSSLFETGVASGDVSRDLFESGSAEAFYVRDDPFVDGAKRKLLSKLAKVAQQSRYKAKDFRSQKEALGYCHATNIMAGEYYESAGKWQLAEAEYMEIIGREAENPWGWLMLGDLYAMTGYPDKAERCFETVARLVPRHESAKKGGQKSKD